VKRVLTEAEAFRAQELLLDRALNGLTPPEAAELAGLGADGDDSFDLAAAALDVATVRIEPMPAGVADRILAAASAALRSPGPARIRETGAPPIVPQTLTGVVPARVIDTRPPRLVEPEPPALAAPLAPAPLPAPPFPAQRGQVVNLADRRRSRAPMIAAWAAAAACLALAVGAVLWARGRELSQVATPTSPTPTPSAARAELLAAGDTAMLPWKSTGDAAAQGASGDVVWSPTQQRGYMRFRGLAPNDPKVSQYQLWIFDKLRDDKFPVDGGVFDVDGTGEVIVPISAKLRVGDAVLFAVTVEAPGGVVVSKRERIVVTAAPAQAG
jgi:hypothetical protein